LKAILSKIFRPWKDDQTRKTADLAVLFADIAGSTRLYECLGDKCAQNLIARCLDILSEVTDRHKGKVIKTIGDEIMSVFPSADNAVEAAEEMHRSLGKVHIADTAPPNIRIGIHTGPTIIENNDVFGDTVNVAARMAAIAKQRQIITTQETVDALIHKHQRSYRLIDRTTVKGKSGELNIYELIWERQAVTLMVTDSYESKPLFSCIKIRMGDYTVEVSKDKPCVTMGRQSHNDLTVEDDRVSRSHARIEYRRGKFVLIDQSTNGTCLSVKGERSVNIKRDEVTLKGEGIIGLGREVTPDSPDAIHFSIRS